MMGLTLRSLLLMSCCCQQEICKKLHTAIDKIDEARYDVEAKVQKADKEVKHKVYLQPAR